MPPTSHQTDPLTLPDQHWTLEEIPWTAIRGGNVVNEERLFYLITTASFMKSATRLYAHNLISYCAGNAEATDWLERRWWPQELQHGLALRRYIQTVWPQFDWDSVYEYFFKEFAIACRGAGLSPNKSLEMVSCCAVEMGNVSYYSALGELTEEPVLRLLARHIGEDETRHYQHFCRYYHQYRQAENITRSQVLRTMWRRLRQLNGNDAIIVMKHVYGACHPGEPFNGRVYRRMQKRCRHLVAHHFPRTVGAEMALKPLGLGLATLFMARPILGRVAQRFMT